MKKKWAVCVAVIATAGLMLAACGGSSKNGGDASSSAASAEAAAPAGETYDTGVFSVLVPDGWKAFPVSDVWSEDEGDIDDTQLYVYKGASEEIDMFSKCGATISYYSPETTLLSARDWYEDVKDLDPVTVNGITWTGFTGTSFDIPCAVFNTGEDGEVRFAVTFTLEAGESEKISPTDADVQAILGSVRAD